MTTISNFIPDNLIEYIEVKSDYYFVKRRINKKIISFGKFNSLNEACAAANLLENNKWNLLNVSNNPLGEYNNEYFVFKVEENRLIVEKKFSSYETAVEYIEINLKNNDMDNDIFSKKRNRKKREFKIPYESFDELNEDNQIHKVNDKFVIKRNVLLNNFKYGEFESFEEAKVAKKLLLKYNWNITNDFEILFENNFYWIFKFSEGKLLYLTKFESYEDAFDYVDSLKYEDYPNNKISDKSSHLTKTKIDLFKTTNTLGKRLNPQITKTKKKNLKSIRLKFTYETKNHIKNPKVWNPKIKKDNLNNFKITIERGGVKVKKLHAILEFTFYKDYYEVVIKSQHIRLKQKSISNFSEFNLIHYILKTHDWNLSKIQKSSAIYHYKSKYYKILILNGNTIIFEEYNSYYLAENHTLTYGKKIFTKKSFYCPLDIIKVNKGYELVKIHNGNTIRLHPLNLLEQVKIAHDILLNENWDLKIFKKYDYFYLNGLYWRFEVNNNEIKLVSRLETIN